MKLSIGFVTLGLPFDGDTIKEKSLGGSETALAYMAKLFASRGHRVKVFCSCNRPGRYDGVEYHDAESLNIHCGIQEFDVLIVSRWWNFLADNFKAKQVVYWAHDMPHPPSCDRNTFMSHIFQTDHIFLMSEFQKKAYVEYAPDCENLIHVTKNGIDLPFIEKSIKGVKRNKKRLIYAARPERGLLYLLREIWPVLINADKELELCISSYDIFGVRVPPETQDIYVKCRDLQNKLPGINNFGDLKKEDYYKLLASCRAMIYPTNFPEISCCPPRTQVTTRKGVCPIEEIEVGDEVLTHKGRYRRVTEVMSRHHDGVIHKIRPTGCVEPLSLTGEHPVFASKKPLYRRDYTDYQPGTRVPIEPDYRWYPSESLEKHHKVLYPFDRTVVNREYLDLSKLCKLRTKNIRNTFWFSDKEVGSGKSHVLPRYIPLDPDLFRLFGYFIADGYAPRSTKRACQLRITFSSNERTYVDDCSSLVTRFFGVPISVVDNDTHVNVEWCSALMVRMFRRMFYRRGKKRIPRVLMVASPENQKELLRGLWRGDGTFKNKYGTYSSTSSVLAYQVRDLLLRTDHLPGGYLQEREYSYKEGTFPSYEVTVKAEGGNFLGEKVCSAPAVDIQSACCISDLGYEMSIRKIETVDYSGSVYNLEVEEDHSYVANGVAVHNCINAMESISCGAPMISTADFALVETVKHGGVLIDKPYASREYKQDFVFRTLEMIQDEDLYRRTCIEGREWISRNYQWQDISLEWEDYFLNFFRKRSSNQLGVLRELVRNDDYTSASKYLERIENKEHPEVKEIAEEVKETLESSGSVLVKDSDTPASVFNEEGRIIGRYKSMLEKIKNYCSDPDKKYTVVDVGCNQGQLTIAVANLLKEMNRLGSLLGLDFNGKCLSLAREARIQAGFSEEQVSFKECWFNQDSLEGLGKFDVVVAGEIMEHCADTLDFLRRCMALTKEGGLVLITCPQGCWKPLIGKPHEMDPRSRGHVHHFEMSDLIDIFGNQPNFELGYVPAGVNYSGELIGNWIITFRHKNEAPPFGERDLERKFLTTRPKEFISAAMIVRDSEDDIRRCLKSFYGCVNQIVVVDTGSNDSTLDIVREFDKKHPDVVIKEIKWPEDFSEARNESIKHCTGDWIFWIDSDEVLINGKLFHKYIKTRVYNGYVVRQNHLMLDYNANPDVPIRLFRNDKGYKFFGCVSGDTLIDCPRDLKKFPDGIPIKDLVGEEGFYTYVYSRKSKRFSLRKVKWCRLTRRDAPVMRLVWKDGYRDKYGELIATPDHPILLRDGTWVRMDRLKPGMSLRPFRRNLNLRKPYPAVYVSPRKLEAEHRFVYKTCHGRIPADYHVHHEDHNILNTSPDNLTLMHEGEHASHHHSGKVVSLETRKRISSSHADVSGSNNPRYGISLSKSTKRKIGKKSKKKFDSLPDDIRKEAIRLWHSGKSYKHLLEGQSNHLVVSCEPFGRQDVYNMEVEGIHNFVANEIVVHNCVHEHCESEMDVPISPAMVLPDVDIAHYGYIVESVRREKCAHRNLALLAKDRRLNPGRRLGIVLLMRDYINLANWDIEKNRGITESSVRYLRACVSTFRSEIRKEDRVYPICVPLYQQALALLGKFGVPITDDIPYPPFEVAFALAAGPGGLDLPEGSPLTPDRTWFATVEEHKQYAEKKREELEERLKKSARVPRG